MKKEINKWVWLVIKQIAWAPILVFLLHLAVSKIFNGYDLWPDVDIPLHLLGGFVIAYFYNEAYVMAKRLKLIGQPAKLVQIILVFALGGTTTVLWEFTEYMSDRLIQTRMLGDLNDTLLDMLLGMVGVVLLLLISRLNKPSQGEVLQDK